MKRTISMLVLLVSLLFGQRAFAQSNQTAVDLAQQIKSLTSPCVLSECTQTASLAQQIVTNLCGNAQLITTPAFIKPDFLYVGSGTASIKVSVGTTYTCALNPVLPDWTVLTSSGVGYIRFGVLANPTTKSREALVTVAGKSFTLHQEAPPAVVTPPPAPTPTSLPAGASIQAALDALPTTGGTVYLTAGVTYTGNITFRNRPGAVTLTTLGFSVPAGTRVTPTDAPTMGKIVCGDCLAPTINYEFGAHDVTMTGVEVIGNPVHNDRPTIVVGLNTSWTYAPTVADQPFNITFDRLYEHADAGGRQGMRTDGVNIKVLNSYISGFWFVGADSQAIGMIQGAGPLLVQNSYLEASGENFLVGGADPTITGLIPADLTFRDNYFFKPLSWKTDHPGSVKNIFELKNAQRVVVDHNVFENVWIDAQPGSAILFTVRDQNGKCPWCTIKDVTFTNNIIKNVQNFAFNILGYDTNFPSVAASNIVIANNLILNANSGLLAQSPMATLQMNNNTFVGITGKFLAFGANPAGSLLNGFVFRDNVTAAGAYGITGDGTTLGTPSLDASVAAGYIFSTNVIEKSADRFIAFPTGNYLLAPGTLAGILNSSYGVADTTFVGSNGAVVGVDVTKLPK
jgi:hypothetical protein